MNKFNNKRGPYTPRPNNYTGQNSTNNVSNNQENDHPVDDVKRDDIKRDEVKKDDIVRDDVKREEVRRQQVRPNQTNNPNPNQQRPPNNYHNPNRNNQGNYRSNPNQNTSNIMLSIVIPLYNEAESLKELAEKIHEACSRERYSYEVIFVDDGSTDSSLQRIREINRMNKRFKCYSFRKNYGKAAALNLGFKKAKGEYIVTMDADLQDDPAEIPNLLRKLKEGYDIVSGWKKDRHDPITKTAPSKFANFFIRLLSGIKLHDFNCGLKAYRKEVCRDINVYGELHRYIPVLAAQHGYKSTEIVVKHHPRKFGKSKYGFKRLFRSSLDILTIVFNTRYSTRPLHFFGGIGLLTFFIGLGINLYLTYLWLFNGIWLGGRPLLFLGVLLIMAGIQFFSVGLLGEMITNTNADKMEPNVKDIIR